MATGTPVLVRLLRVWASIVRFLGGFPYSWTDGAAGKNRRGGFFSAGENDGAEETREEQKNESTGDCEEEENREESEIMFPNLERRGCLVLWSYSVFVFILLILGFFCLVTFAFVGDYGSRDTSNTKLTVFVLVDVALALGLFSFFVHKLWGAENLRHLLVSLNRIARTPSALHRWKPSRDATFLVNLLTSSCAGSLLVLVCIANLVLFAGHSPSPLDLAKLLVKLFAMFVVWMCQSVSSLGFHLVYAVLAGLLGEVADTTEESRKSGLSTSQNHLSTTSDNCLSSSKTSSFRHAFLLHHDPKNDLMTEDRRRPRPTGPEEVMLSASCHRVHQLWEFQGHLNRYFWPLLLNAVLQQIVVSLASFYVLATLASPLVDSLTTSMLLLHSVVQLVCICSAPDLVSNKVTTCTENG